ncbi:hypothetical protein HanRHA438_Chr02g0089811 [Helianthus annuus]|nr:hypothetical protein HanHA300_Chr02g0065481 [Helianthus annuus]KAJ0619678.1 hypothetical protein HanHA89_Chr02g0073921 [Helianthus annuus]KAJ0787138.1 hypothetical protein HanOQP8_Chr02g0079091 [Helianthus annuus]KAJ0941015.1 hypothetical protein HanRHA438_Chr02g0089811 [Helianthus annuus]
MEGRGRVRTSGQRDVRRSRAGGEREMVVERKVMVDLMWESGVEMRGGWAVRSGIRSIPKVSR